VYEKTRILLSNKISSILGAASCIVGYIFYREMTVLGSRLKYVGGIPLLSELDHPAASD
jgi:hypothetical protein